MAAGLGFKTFNTGDVLSAADVNGYLMQGVLVFADATARNAAITSPQEGQFAYLKDTNVTTYYTGSSWANLDTTGMTNPMTTTGDTIYSSSGSTPARLGIGTAGQVLTVNSGATAPEWAAPAGGGKLKQVVSATTTTSTTIATTTFTDTTITATITPTSATSTILVLVQGQVYADRAASQCFYSARLLRDATTIHNIEPAGSYNFSGATNATIQNLFPINWVDSPATTSAITYKVQGKVQSTSSGATTTWQNGGGNATSTITLLEIGA